MYRRFVSISLVALMTLAVLAGMGGVLGEDVGSGSAAPQLDKGQKWSQSMEIDFGDIIDSFKLNENLDELGKELKKEGAIDTFDVNVDIDGGLGLAVTTEIVEVDADFNGRNCHKIRTSAYFGSGLGIEASVLVAGQGNEVKANGNAEYYVEFDLVVDMWVTADELAIMQIDVTLKPEINAEVKADAAGKIENTNFDIDLNGYIRSKDIVGRLTIDFDEPFDYLNLPIEENEEWTARGSFTGTASITGKIEAKIDVTGIPGEDDIHEGETIDLAKESGGPEEFEEDVSLSFESGSKSSMALPDGSTTDVIPVSNVEITELLEDIFDDDDYYDYDDYYYYDEPVQIMKFSVEDGPNENDEVGCFFLIRAEKGVDLDPSEYTFWVAEDGRSPQKLNFQFRDYSQDAMKVPEGGDRNATYRYDSSIKSGRWPDMPAEEDRERWNDGEYLGFDMPTEELGINIINGNVYEVLIKDPNRDIVYRDTFVYKEPYGSRSYEDDDDDDYDYYYYEDDYYYEEEEDAVSSVLGGVFEDMEFLEEIADMGADDFQFKSYYSPEHGVFVKSDVGLTDTALTDISDPDAKKALSSLSVEMKPVTEEEVKDFKDSRDKDYFVPAKGAEERDWVLIGLGILAVVAIIIIVLVIVMRRKSSRPPPSGEERDFGPGDESDPYGVPPPDAHADGSGQRFPPPPEY